MALVRGPTATKKLYNPSDPTVCHSCRAFQAIDHLNAPTTSPNLPAFRETAAKGCLRCKLVVGGTDESSTFGSVRRKKKKKKMTMTTTETVEQQRDPVRRSRSACCRNRSSTHCSTERPSWSWASVEAECQTWVPDPEDEVDIDCQVRYVQCTLASQDPHGHVSDGHITGFAPVFWAILRYEEWGGDDRKEPKYVAHYGGHSEQLDEDVPLGNTEDSTLDESGILIAVIESSKDDVADRRWTGLALKESSRRIGAYERIGRIGGRPEQLPKDEFFLDLMIV